MKDKLQIAIRKYSSGKAWDICLTVVLPFCYSSFNLLQIEKISLNIITYYFLGQEYSLLLCLDLVLFTVNNVF